MSRAKKFSVNHAALAALRCPFYITTNYDCLFEEAWNSVNANLPNSTLHIVTTDSDINEEFDAAKKDGRTILYKIHGSSDRDDELLILSRRDYRSHYRFNLKLFEEIRHLLRVSPTLFVGFSHTDPEATRLVEDAIFEFEKEKNSKQSKQASPAPQFYSLQFDFNADHTPEIFAARGLVALRPPIPQNTLVERNIISYRLALGLIDLLGAKTARLHEAVALDSKLEDVKSKIEKTLLDSLNCLEEHEEYAISTLLESNIQQRDYSWMFALRDDLQGLGNLASQGVYLLDGDGLIQEFCLPDGLSRKDREGASNLSDRPYFRQAKFFRESFVSDSDASIFNKLSTFFLCNPIEKDGRMIGLLFSACQIGQWTEPINIAENLWKEATGQEAKISILLIDANGVCLLPPLKEFKEEPSIPFASETDEKNNIGYSYTQLLALSRRDNLIRHISNNIVPVQQDDDVLRLSPDFEQFTVITDIDKAHWKLALSLQIPKRGKV